ncbi:nucleotidyltransferase domain-containing protein [Bradyrhizobium sp. HKCCYLS20291]|uniref:nucleotidyltransferase domain-containing protein n=1 Tax=Bradyrhizobium sp. HKCCYLS20291 TaxID=3420766 RepID=UPI003EBD1C61
MRALAAPSAQQSAAFQLALACTRAPVRGTSAQAVERAVGRVDDWQQLLRVIKRHRIAGLAHRALQPHAAEVPEFVRAILSREAGAIARTGLVLTSESIRLDAAFRAVDIDLGFLKGPVLSMQLYGDVGRRYCRDLDLFVAPTDLARATDVLQQLGYVAAGELPGGDIAAWTHRLNEWEFRHRDSGILIELHWRLCPNAALGDLLAAKLSWSDVGIGSDRTLRTLGGDTLLAYLCLHGGLHAWSRLKWLADIDVLLSSSADLPQRLLTLSDQIGLRRPVGQALWLAAELLETPLDPATRQVLAQDRAVRRLGRVALAAMTAGGGEAELENTAFGMTRVRLSHFALRGGWRHWWSQAQVALASSDDIKRMRLPRWLGFAYPVLRPVLWGLRKLTGPARGGGCASQDRRAIR